MKLTRSNGRNARCPKLESLESRQLLSTVPSLPQPAGTTSTAPLAAYDLLIGASSTRVAYGVDGTGLTVAVIDTGVNYNHEALGGGFGAGKKVIAGYDYAMGKSDPFATTWEHGTAVSGLIASSDPAHLGVAPGADIVALRVFGDDNQGDYNRIADSLQYVLDNHTKYHISVVNLSIADGNNYTQNIFAGDGGVGQRITQLISKLKAINIPVVSATGNNFTGQPGQGFTAIDPDTISVTSTDGTNGLAANAQRLGGPNGTDIAAPGTGLVAPIQNNEFQSVDGTSFATALVSGSVVLLQSIYMKQFGALPTVTQIEGWLRSGGTSLTDPITNITLGRLDLTHSAALIPTAPKLPPVPLVTPSVPVVNAPPRLTLPTVSPATVKTETPVVAVVAKSTVVATFAPASKPKSTQSATIWNTWVTNLGSTFKSWKVWTVGANLKPGPSQPAGSFPKPNPKLATVNHPKAPKFAKRGTTTPSPSKVA